jgi:hypothetical protein
MGDAILERGVLVGEDPPWEPWRPEHVAELLGRAALRWYVVAGWAIDLFIGRETRVHEDIEIGVPAAAFPSARDALGAFELDVVGDGRRWALDDVAAFELHFQTWVRDPNTGVYHLDVFRDPHDGDTWLCRRDTSISMPYDELVRRTSGGIPYMAPHVVLLFKAKHDRAKDRHDLDTVLPALSDVEREWLGANLARLHPGHPWLGTLGHT